jgi:hypothetical protein
LPELKRQLRNEKRRTELAQWDLLRDNLDENGSDNQSLKWRPVAKS